MTAVLYQAKAGDGVLEKGITRKNTFLKTPKEALTEAFALKERLDKRYDHKIEWNYHGKVTGKRNKVKFLTGHLTNDNKSKDFYLAIVKVNNDNETLDAISPNQPNTVTANDEKVVNKVLKLIK